MLRRIPWPPLLASIVIVLSSAFAASPVRDAATFGDVTEAYLVRPLGYVVLAPVSALLDMLTLMSVRQHIAFVAGWLVLFALWRALVAWRAPTSVRRHVLTLAVLVGMLLVSYAAAALLPRPMAALVSDNANVLLVDFHSHTSASHDVRSAWTAERNREWHRDGGYDVAYVTDHAAVAGAEQGMARNPVPAGNGVTILQGIEVTWAGEHVGILGGERTYKGLLTPNRRDVDEQALQLASLLPNREPVVVWNHPRRPNQLPLANAPGTAAIRAIEISNGSPKDIDQVRPRQRELVRLAEERNVAMTTGSDNHGWGRTAPNWTLLAIVGWRGLAGDALARQIEITIRSAGLGSSRVVERRVFDATTGFAVALTSVAAPARMLTTLSNDERVSWLIWIWLIFAASRVLRRKPGVTA